MPRHTFFGVTANLSTKHELLSLVKAGETLRIATINPEFVLLASKNTAFEAALASMTHCTVDGFGLRAMLGIVHPRLKTELYAGATFVADLFSAYKNGEKKFYFIGGPEGLAKEAAATIGLIYHGIAIVGAEDGGRINPENPVDGALVERINKSGADIVLVNFGAPRQELWIQAATGLKAQVAIGVGGTLNFYVNRRRAPQIFRALHFEWLWRGFTEKGHWKRLWKAVIVFPFFALFHPIR